MRIIANLIMWNIITVDGYFEGNTSWDLPWHELIWSEDLEDFVIAQLSSTDALLFGRVTYEGMAKYWSKETGVVADYMNSLTKYVISKTLKKAEWENSRIINAAIDEAIINLKTALEKDIYIFGSSMLVQKLIEMNLIDEYRIGIAPHIHGSGNLLFKPGLPELDLRLTKVQQMKNDALVISYQPKR